MDRITEICKIVLGAAVTAVSGFFGGLDGVMYALIAFITVDYLTGVAVAVKNKTISSQTGFRGLLKKAVILCIVGLANVLDANVIGSGDVFRTAAALYYIGNEGISLVENAAKLGVPVPEKICAVFAQLKNDNEKQE